MQEKNYMLSEIIFKNELLPAQVQLIIDINVFRIELRKRIHSIYGAD